MPPDLSSPNYASAISSIESGGNYSILGPETKGDRAYGKYQVMGANIGPWSKEVLGFEVTPQQFLGNPQIQDAVFQGKFGQYVDKYGPEGAAQAWFAGPGGVGKTDRRDVLGTSVGAYGQKFMKALGAPEAPQGQPIAPGSSPVPVLSQGMPAYGWTPNNAPAGISGGQEQAPQADPGMAQMSAPPPPMAHRRPPDPRHIQALMQLAPAIAPGFRFMRQT